MSFDFFEGAAGTGKTHSAIARAEQLVQEVVLGEGHKLLALTFMNGARRRLEARFSANSIFRNRFECQTFDAFARTVAVRRRSLVTAALRAQADALDEFDGPCCIAAALLEQPSVRQWVARSYPVIVIDEAQDLDSYRFRILQGLSQSCRTIAAADAFQCLATGQDIAALMNWLQTSGERHVLAQARRTNQQGLLAAALAVRNGTDIKAGLTESTFSGRSSWSGAGFRLLQTPAKIPLVAWSIGNEMAQRGGQFVILTPDARNATVRGALTVVQTRQWERKNSDVTFGPFPHTWDHRDTEEVESLLASIVLPQQASHSEMCAILAPLSAHAPVAHAIARIDRLRRVKGQTVFSADHIIEYLRDAVRNRSRRGGTARRGHMAMTIHRAKNLNFPM